MNFSTTFKFIEMQTYTFRWCSSEEREHRAFIWLWRRLIEHSQQQLCESSYTQLLGDQESIIKVLLTIGKTTVASKLLSISLTEVHVTVSNVQCGFHYELFIFSVKYGYLATFMVTKWTEKPKSRRKSSGASLCYLLQMWCLSGCTCWRCPSSLFIFQEAHVSISGTNVLGHTSRLFHFQVLIHPSLIPTGHHGNYSFIDRKQCYSYYLSFSLLFSSILIWY